MTDRIEQDFYRRREQEARAMAERAQDHGIRAIHEEFAHRYAERLAALGPSPQR
jgi:hypothetical protein